MARVLVTAVVTLCAALTAATIFRFSELSSAGPNKDVADGLLAVGGTVGGMAGLAVTSVVFAIQSVTTRLGRLEFFLPILVRRQRFLELATGILTFVGLDIVAGLYFRLRPESSETAWGDALLATSVVGSLFSMIAVIVLFRRCIDLAGRDLMSPELIVHLVHEHHHQLERQQQRISSRHTFDKALQQAGWGNNPWMSTFSSSPQWAQLRIAMRPGRIVAVNTEHLRLLRGQISAYFGRLIEIDLTSLHDTNIDAVTAAFKIGDRGLPDNWEGWLLGWSRQLGRAFRVRPIRVEQSILERLVLTLPAIAQHDGIDRFSESLQVTSELLLRDIRANAPECTVESLTKFSQWIDLIDVFAGPKASTRKLKLVLRLLDRLTTEAGIRGRVVAYKWGCTLLGVLYDRCARAGVDAEWIDEQYDDLLYHVLFTLPVKGHSTDATEQVKVLQPWFRLFLNCCRTAGELKRFGTLNKFVDRFKQVVERDEWLAEAFPNGALHPQITPRLRQELLVMVFLAGWLIKLVSEAPEIGAELKPAFDVLHDLARIQELIYVVWRTTPDMIIERGIVERPQDWGHDVEQRSMIAFTDPPAEWPKLGLIALMLMSPSSRAVRWDLASGNIVTKPEDLEIQEVEAFASLLLSQPKLVDLLLQRSGDGLAHDAPDRAYDGVITTVQLARLATAKSRLTNLLLSPLKSSLIDAFRVNTHRVMKTMVTDENQWARQLMQLATPGNGNFPVALVAAIPRRVLTDSEPELTKFFARTHGERWLRKAASELTNEIARLADQTLEISPIGVTVAVRDAVQNLHSRSFSPNAIIVYGGGAIRAFIDRGQHHSFWQAGTFEGIPVFNAPSGGAGERWILVLDAKAALRYAAGEMLTAVNLNNDDVDAIAQAADQLAKCEQEAALPRDDDICVEVRIEANVPLSIVDPKAIIHIRIVDAA